MKKFTIIKARDVAQQFHIRANEVLALIRIDWESITGYPETAALRRTSMELTKILAKLRQNK